MLINGHLITLVVVLTLLILPIKKLWKHSTALISSNADHGHINFSSRLVTFCILFFMVSLSARGTVGHRPINPSLVYFSTDPLINSLTLNSTYSVAFALKQMGDEKRSIKMYGEMDEQQVIDLVRQEMNIKPGIFNSEELPTLTSRYPSCQCKPKNLVIILEESLGAQYVSSLGGIPLTPEIDRLYKEGWAFERLYATGTRSARGIEAITTGFPPTPSRAVVKLDKSQHNFFTIASLLKRNGYETQFIYGGESHFDNMKSFFLGNGFTSIVDFDDIENPKFIASWGASDEDLFAQADRELTKLHNNNKPFFSLIFSSSNHDPFDIPENVVSPIKYTEKQLQTYDETELLRHQAIQYADYSLGKFIAKAKTQPYWKDTLFLVVADHDARVIGRDLVPLYNFHIPGVILNSGREPFTDQRLVSQIDLPPTLLSLMGVVNNSPMIGHDLTNPKAGGRAMMQYSDNFAYMKESSVAILQPQKPALNFNYDYQARQLSSQPADKKLNDIALAHVLWGSLAYQNQWYRD
jgi:phosphoglycerol transferase MdoB-like AlkP superfamily enzyme